MASRVHITVKSRDKELFRRIAEREGLSLSAWFRHAARDRAAAVAARTCFSTVDELWGFFADCDREERGTEPDWVDPLAVRGGSPRRQLERF